MCNIRSFSQRLSAPGTRLDLFSHRLQSRGGASCYRWVGTGNVVQYSCGWEIGLRAPIEGYTYTSPTSLQTGHCSPLALKRSISALQTSSGSKNSSLEHFLQLSCSVYLVYTEATCNQLELWVSLTTNWTGQTHPIPPLATPLLQKARM